MILWKNLSSSSPSTKRKSRLYAMPDAQKVLDVQLVHSQVVLQEDLQLCAFGGAGDVRKALVVAMDEEEVREIGVLDQLRIVGRDDDLLLPGGVRQHPCDLRDQVRVNVALGFFNDRDRRRVEVQGDNQGSEVDSTIGKEGSRKSSIRELFLGGNQ